MEWWFIKRKGKVEVVQPHRHEPDVAKVSTEGKELHVNANTSVSLERCVARLERIKKAIERCTDESKLAKLNKTKEKLKAMVFILEDD